MATQSHQSVAGASGGQTSTYAEGFVFSHLTHGTDELVVAAVDEAPPAPALGEATTSTAALAKARPKAAVRRLNMVSPDGDEQCGLPERRWAQPVVRRSPQPSLLDALPSLVVSIRKVLVGRGVVYETAEDIAQETAARALPRAGEFDDARSFERWCFAVAWNLARDDWRRQQRFANEAAPDRPAAGVDVHRVVQYRLAEQEMLDAAARLPAELRESFIHTLRRLDEPLADGPRDRRRRFDVRRRLLASIENYPAVVALRMRQWLGERATAGLRWAGLFAVPVVAPIAISLFVAVEFNSLDRPVATATPDAVELISATAPPPPTMPTPPKAPAAGSAPAADPGRPGRTGPKPPDEVTLVRYPNAGGGSGSVSLTPNERAKPMACAGLGSLELCIDKPGAPFHHSLAPQEEQP